MMTNMGPVSRRALWTAMLLVGSAGGAASEGVHVADPGDLQVSMAAMPEGGTLLLGGGDWGDLVLKDRSWPDGRPLVLQAADPSDPPRFTAGLISNVEGVVLDGIVVDHSFESGDEYYLPVFRVEKSRNITIQDSLFDGDDAWEVSPVDDGFPTSYGLNIRWSSDVTIRGNEVRNFLRGVVVSESRNLAVLGNDIHSIRSDGMNFAQVEDVLIEGNHIHDFRRSLASDDHADMIQFWTTQTETPTRDVVIRGNLLNSGKGWHTQSIFMRNERVDLGQAGAEMFYGDVTIEENVILNAHLHGITVGEADGLIIRNNTVVRNGASEGDMRNPDLWTPQIAVAPASRDVSIARNIVFRIQGHEGQPTWFVEGNVLVQDRSRMQPGFYGMVFVGGDPGQPGSFAPRPGGQLDGTGAGAPLRAHSDGSGQF